jgi:hypothetical protein
VLMTKWRKPQQPPGESNPDQASSTTVGGGA